MGRRLAFRQCLHKPCRPASVPACSPWFRHARSCHTQTSSSLTALAFCLQSRYRADSADRDTFVYNTHRAYTSSPPARAIPQCHPGYPKSLFKPLPPLPEVVLHQHWGLSARYSMLGTQHTTPNTTSYSGVDLHQSKATMNLSLANATPSEHQKRCIERMLQTKKFNIVQNLLAWKIHFAFPDALPYVDITNSNESLASGLDVFAPFRLYSTFNNDHRDCLASLADVPFHTVERWIRESGKHA